MISRFLQRKESFRLVLKRLKRGGLMSDNLFPPSSDDSEEEKDATGGELKGF